MKTKKIVLIVVLVSLTNLKVLSQSNEAMAIEYSSYTGSALLKESGKFIFAVPVFHSGNSRLFLLPEYKFIYGNAFDIIPENYYHQLSLRWAWQYKINRAWRLQWVGMPALTSPFEDNQAVLFNTIFRANYKAGHLLCSFGLAYSYRYKNNIIIPVAGVAWQPNEHWTIHVKFPVNMNVQYKINRVFNVGLGIAGNGLSSLVENQNYDFLWIHERNLSLYSDVKLYKNWWLSGSFGYALKRTLKTYSMPENAIWTIKSNLGEPGLIPINEFSEPGFVAKIGIKFKLER